MAFGSVKINRSDISVNRVISNSEASCIGSMVSALDVRSESLELEYRRRSTDQFRYIAVQHANHLCSGERTQLAFHQSGLVKLVPDNSDSLGG